MTVKQPTIISPALISEANCIISICGMFPTKRKYRCNSYLPTSPSSTLGHFQSAHAGTFPEKNWWLWYIKEYMPSLGTPYGQHFLATRQIFFLKLRKVREFKRSQDPRNDYSSIPFTTSFSNVPLSERQRPRKIVPALLFPTLSLAAIESFSCRRNAFTGGNPQIGNHIPGKSFRPIGVGQPQAHLNAGANVDWIKVRFAFHSEKGKRERACENRGII